MTIENIEYRHINLGKLETRLDDTQDGSFAGYANLHEVTDSYATRFASGAWTREGIDGTYALLWMHDPDQPVGVFTAREDDRGLYIEGRYDDTPEGERARKRARSGSAPELSVGFVRTSVDPDDEYRITSARLVEVSQITARMASQPGAELTAVRKAAELMKAEDERATELPEGTAGIADPAHPLTVANPGEAPPADDPGPHVVGELIDHDPERELVEKTDEPVDDGDLEPDVVDAPFDEEEAETVAGDVAGDVQERVQRAKRAAALLKLATITPRRK